MQRGHWGNVVVAFSKKHSGDKKNREKKSHRRSSASVLKRGGGDGAPPWRTGPQRERGGGVFTHSSRINSRKLNKCCRQLQGESSGKDGGKGEREGEGKGVFLDRPF